MRVLLDECTPRIVKTRLPALSISTVQEVGWSGGKNGESLRRAASMFDVFITTDQNLRYQQNLAAGRLAVIVLPSNQVPVVAMLLPASEQTLRTISPGTVMEIPLPSNAP